MLDDSLYIYVNCLLIKRLKTNIDKIILILSECSASEKTGKCQGIFFARECQGI